MNEHIYNRVLFKLEQGGNYITTWMNFGLIYTKCLEQIYSKNLDYTVKPQDLHVLTNNNNYYIT